MKRDAKPYFGTKPAIWEQSGRDFGRAEPPPPTLRIERRSDGALNVRLDEFEGMEWRVPWGGSEAQLLALIEVVANEYWGDYCDPGYKFWHFGHPPA